MEKKVILDTGAIIDFFADRGDSNTVKKLLIDGRAVISSISVYELFAGVSSKKHLEQREKFLTLCDIADLDAKTARMAAGLFTELKKSGITIDNEDILIAATCVSQHCLLVTTNRKHFSLFKHVEFYE